MADLPDEKRRRIEQLIQRLLDFGLSQAEREELISLSAGEPELSQRLAGTVALHVLLQRELGVLQPLPIDESLAEELLFGDQLMLPEAAVEARPRRRFSLGAVRAALEPIRRSPLLSTCAASLLFYAGLGLVLIACTDSGRRQVEGTVSLDGRPLAAGTVTFIPTANTAGPSAGGPITAGKFSIPAEAGPFKGKYRVRIFADRQTGRKVNDPSFGLIPERERVRFEEDAHLSAEVVELAKNSFSFSLTSIQ